MMHSKYESLFARQCDIVRIGKLNLPSGRLVACDPYFCGEAKPFSRQVAPGQYDVELCRAQSQEFGQRIALARLRISSNSAAGSELAVTEATYTNAYTVESGIGCFMDETTRILFADLLKEYYRMHPQGNYYSDVLATEFKVNAAHLQDNQSAIQWNLHFLPRSSLNIAMFSTGLGDGEYSSFCLMDAEGEMVSFVTDFAITIH